jgi:hypothetical protein
MGVFSERQRSIAIVTIAMVVLQVTASVMFLAVYDFDVKALAANPGALPARGAEVAGLLRLGGLVDLLGYLALAPVVLYLHLRLGAVASERVKAWGLVNLLTVSGLGFVLVGSVGAALYASVGPPLIDASASGSETAAAAHVAFAALGNGIVVGLWGTLEQLLLGVWLIGAGWLMRNEGRAFGWLAVIAGIGALSYATRTGLSGHPPGDLTAPLDIVIFAGFGLFFAWLVWVAVRLWQGRQAGSVR